MDQITASDSLVSRMTEDFETYWEEIWRVIYLSRPTYKRSTKSTGDEPKKERHCWGGTAMSVA